MNRQPLPQPASTNTAPKSLQEKSNKIELLADAMQTRILANLEGLNFVSMINDEPRWWPELPEPQAIYFGDLMMGTNGILYECFRCLINPENFVWIIISEGLESKLQEQPHTFGFAQMDTELITDHIRDAVKKWLIANFSEEQITLVIDQLKIQIEDRQPVPVYSNCLILLSRVIDLLSRISPIMCDSLRTSDRLACRISPLLDLHRGISQSLDLASNLIRQADALTTEPDIPR